MRWDLETALRGLAAGGAMLWGGLPLAVQVLIGLMAFDIATGLLAAGVHGELASEVSFQGLSKKVMVLLAVGLAAWLQQVVALPLAEAVAGFYAAGEGLSCLENMTRAGLPVPGVLRQALRQLPGAPPEGGPDGAGPAR